MGELVEMRGAAPAVLPVADPEKLHPPSPMLAVLARRWAKDGDVGPIPSGVVREASDRLRLLTPMLRPADREAVWTWIKGLGKAGLTHRPVGQEAAAEAATGIWETCRGLPMAVWVDETRLAFQAVQRFWPSPADVMQFLLPYADALQRQRGACEAIVEGWKRQEQIRERAQIIEDKSPEAQAEISRLVASLRSGRLEKPLSRLETNPGASVSMAKHLSPAVLLADYRRMAASEPRAELRQLAELRIAGLLRKHPELAGPEG